MREVPQVACVLRFGRAWLCLLLIIPCALPGCCTLGLVRSIRRCQRLAPDYDPVKEVLEARLIRLDRDNLRLDLLARLASGQERRATLTPHVFSYPPATGEPRDPPGTSIPLVLPLLPAGSFKDGVEALKVRADGSLETSPSHLTALEVNRCAILSWGGGSSATVYLPEGRTMPAVLESNLGDYAYFDFSLYEGALSVPNYPGRIIRCFLFPLAVPLDIVTSPIQIPMYLSGGEGVRGLYTTAR